MCIYRSDSLLSLIFFCTYAFLADLYGNVYRIDYVTPLVVIYLTSSLYRSDMDYTKLSMTPAQCAKFDKHIVSTRIRAGRSVDTLALPPSTGRHMETLLFIHIFIYTYICLQIHVFIYTYIDVYIYV
jgi:hypothetical protein